MNKKTVLVFLSIVVILIGFFLFLRVRSTQKNTQTNPQPTAKKSFTLPENLEKEAEIDLSPRFDKKAVNLKISKIPQGVSVVEYELAYEAKGGLPRGVLGKIEVKSGQTTILREILLGTCSKNVCVYDEGVAKVSLTLKFTRIAGQSTGFTQEYQL